MRYIQTTRSEVILLEDPVIEFEKDMGLVPGEEVCLISRRGVQVNARVDDVDDFTVYFLTIG